MNMIRLWGGGQFEYDQFYELCDQNGILIWHDMMFACAMYPGKEDEIQKMIPEIVDNVQRLRNHPSIALWNGNNEVWIGWQEWGWQSLLKTQAERDLVYNWYDRIFNKEIPAVLSMIDPDRFYWPTSPTSSYSKGAEGMKSGDVHYWGVWAGKADIETYNTNIARFMSEFGMQGMVPMTSLRQFT